MAGSLVTIVKVEFLYDKPIPNPKPFSNPNPNLLRVRKVRKKSLKNLRKNNAKSDKTHPDPDCV
jgi:hypothetical protein